MSSSLFLSWLWIVSFSLLYNPRFFLLCCISWCLKSFVVWYLSKFSTQPWNIVFCSENLGMCSFGSFNFVKLHLDTSAYCNKDISGFVVCDLLVEGMNLTTWSLTSKAYLWPEIHVKLTHVDFEVVNSCNGLLCFLEPLFYDPVWVCGLIVSSVHHPFTSMWLNLRMIFVSGFRVDTNSGKYKVVKLLYCFIVRSSA